MAGHIVPAAGSRGRMFSSLGLLVQEPIPWNGATTFRVGLPSSINPSFDSVARILIGFNNKNPEPDIIPHRHPQMLSLSRLAIA